MVLDSPYLELVMGALVFAVGACLGSFLNVVAYRVPLGMSVVKPASACPHCGTPVPWWGNVPVLGWFIVRGRCVACKEPVSWEYPLVEALTGLGVLGVVFYHTDAAELLNVLTGGGAGAAGFGELRYGFVPKLAASLWLFLTAVPLVLIDLRYRLLPDVITLPGAVVAFLIGCTLPHFGWQGALLGALVGAGGLYAVAKTYELLRKREGMGLGDVKYLALVGALVGWQGVLLTLALASFFGAIVGVALGVVRREGLQAAIPFGPFLAGGAIVVNLWGDALQLLLYG